MYCIDLKCLLRDSLVNRESYLIWYLYFIFFPISPKTGKNWHLGASLMAQWLRIRLPMQGTWVQALVQEDPTCHGATKPVHHNYWTCTLEPMSHNYWSLHAESLCSATRENTTMRSLRTTMKSSPRSPQVEKARAQQWRHGAAKNKKKNK